eukprot:12823503-Alexandrium_andersonii.AAC.1
MAMYGVAAAAVPMGKLRHLRSHAASALDPKAATGRGVDLAFEACEGFEVDPAVHVLLERIAAVRRIWFVSPEVREALGDVLALLEDQGHPGCASNPCVLG